MKIAIIGSGISGLASAYFLRKYDCELFEAKSFLTLAGHGMKLDNGNVIDIPLRVIHPEYYPNLLSLCQEVGVDLRTLEHSGSFSRPRISEKFDYFNLNIFNKRYNFIKPKWKYLKIGLAFLRFYYLCLKYRFDPNFEKISYGEFLKKYKISDDLSLMVLYPLISSICTCNYEELDRFPARVLLEMMSRIAGPVSMERFYGGTHDIEKALCKHLDKVKLNSKVEKIEVFKDKVELVVNGETRIYDHVVLAIEAHFIKDILVKNECTKEVLEGLSTIPYRNSDTIIHTVDASNEQVQDEKSLHYQEYPCGGEAQATMWLNKVEPQLTLNDHTMQTWNPYEDKVSNELKRSSLNRALMTVESYRAVKKLKKFTHPSFSLAGSYLASGVPLLEGGVESALHLSDSIETSLRN